MHHVIDILLKCQWNVDALNSRIRTRYRASSVRFQLDCVRYALCECCVCFALWRDVVIMTDTLINPDECGQGSNTWIYWHSSFSICSALMRNSSVCTDAVCDTDLFASEFWLYVYSVAVVALNVLRFLISGCVRTHLQESDYVSLYIYILLSIADVTGVH